VKVEVHTISGFGASDKRQPDLIMKGGAQTLDGAKVAAASRDGRGVNNSRPTSIRTAG
jgi:hypothetical protein